MKLSMEKTYKILKNVISCAILLFIIIYLAKQIDNNFFSYNQEKCQKNRESMGGSRIAEFLKNKPCERPLLLKSCAPFCIK
jgi:hypothetical protein